jgi:UDP-2,3-diacylglucosamine pyrophosphatase LpxH
VWGGKEFLLTRSGKDWIFVSDAHFTGKDREEMETFLRFLDLEKEHVSHLVILGDLFEFFLFPLPNISPSLKNFKPYLATASILRILREITIFF